MSNPHLRQEFLSIALSSLTKDLTLNESQYSDFQDVLIKMISNIDLSNIDAPEAKKRFKLIMDRASNKGNIYIGIYIAYILTHDAMQGGLDTFHNLGSTDIAKSNLRIQLSDITQFRKTKFSNTIVPVRFNKYLNIYHLNMIAESFVGIFLEDVIDQLEITPRLSTKHEYLQWKNKQWIEIDTINVKQTMSNKLSIGITLDPRRMEDLDITLELILQRLSRTPFSRKSLNAVFISRDSLLFYLVLGEDTSKANINKKLNDLINKANKLLLRGHRNIQDLFINYDERQSLPNYKLYTDVPDYEISYAFTINSERALKYITTHPLVEEVITVRHGGLYDKAYGIVQTSNFIMRNKDLFKYQDLYVSILAQLLTLSGNLNSVIDSIKHSEDVLTSSFGGRSMETLIDFAVTKTGPRQLGNIAHFSIFGRVLQERTSSEMFHTIKNQLFGDVKKQERTEQTAAKLFTDYIYEL